MLNNRVVKNASWIIICKVVQAVLTFVVTFLTARFLEPAGYGVINYAASVVAFFVPILCVLNNSYINYKKVLNFNIFYGKISLYLFKVGILSWKWF